MPPGIGYGDGTTGLLEGLVGGFLTGHDFRTQRDDRKRRLAAEQQAAMQAAEDRRIAAEDRARGRAVEDIGLRDKYGLEFGAGGPEVLTGVNDHSVEEVYGAAPPGFRRVGPSAEQRAANQLMGIRRGVGAFIQADPETQRRMLGDPSIVGALTDGGINLDDYLERTTPRSLTATVTGDGVSVPNVPLDEVATIRGQIPQKPPEADAGFDTTNALADDFRLEAADAEAIGKAVAQASQAGDNAIGDQTLVFSLNNILDPGVSVRQDDFVRYAEAGGLESRAQRYWNMIGADGRLPANIREQLLAEIEGNGAINQQRFERVRERYRKMAERFGVDFGLIDRDPFAAGGMFDDLVPQ